MQKYKFGILVSLKNASTVYSSWKQFMFRTKNATRENLSHNIEIAKYHNLCILEITNIPFPVIGLWCSKKTKHYFLLSVQKHAPKISK
jgi:hypothetical protein